MNCQQCGTEIIAGERFCRNCGASAYGTAPTVSDKTFVLPQQQQPTQGYAAPQTTPAWQPQQSAPLPPFSPPVIAAAPPRRSASKWPLIFVAGLIAVVAIGAIAFFALRAMRNSNSVAASGALPDHFGIFVRDGDSLNELRRRDFSNAVEGRDSINNDSSLVRADGMPTVILYAEAQDIPVADLKLVQVDSIDSDGNAKYWSYQVSPVEGRSGMKQIKVAGGLPTGRYAFALFNGYVNEGNHKLWPFEVENGVSSPSESPQVAKLQVKPTPSPTPAQSRQPATAQQQQMGPPGARLGYCNDNNVVVRAMPDLNGAKINKLDRGQKVWVLGVSPNYSTWNGITSNWTQVQTYDGSRGWVFSPFISY
ncbi:MAG: hypothetical protein AUG51_26650 [Acidobacteria bacterium 13_1_20CM_3_53_8]|nr:MAG: hypothetical protein AUG51_26650 [Acidobacteria bacterium 13_1_20CM_3_53_8]